ncbi:hypothetical protein D3C86_2021970 [compost metagenome]
MAAQISALERLYRFGTGPPWQLDHQGSGIAAKVILQLPATNLRPHFAGIGIGLKPCESVGQQRRRRLTLDMHSTQYVLMCATDPEHVFALTLGKGIHRGAQTA